jgi:hypothetical protein
MLFNEVFFLPMVPIVPILSPPPAVWYPDEDSSVYARKLMKLLKIHSV